MTLIQRIPKNLQGRDFVIGDLHGCLPLLQRLLDRVNFDPAQDRLFSTGDLIDRGPFTPDCLRFLNEPWFFMVMGNHEWMLLKYLESRQINKQSDATLYALDNLVCNGGKWVLTYEEVTGQSLLDLQPQLKALPFILSVGHSGESDRFHVTHGDLLMDDGQMLSNERIDALEDADNSPWNLAIFGANSDDEIVHAGIWSRRLFGEPSEYSSIKWLEDLSLVYVGHTITQKPRLVASHLFIDGGSFLAYHHKHNAKAHGLHLIDHARRRGYWSNGWDVAEFAIPDLEMHRHSHLTELSGHQ